MTSQLSSTSTSQSIQSPLSQLSSSIPSAAALPPPDLVRINYTQQQRQFGSIPGNGNTTRVIKVAFVRPVFTYAAYELNGFYNFYTKYRHVTPGTNVTTDL